MSEPSGHSLTPASAAGDREPRASAPVADGVRSGWAGRAAVMLVVGLVLGALSVAGFHWHRTGGLVGARDGARRLAVEPAPVRAPGDDSLAAGRVDRTPPVDSYRVGAAALTQVGLVHLLGWQRIDAARSALGEAGAAWKREDGAGALEVAGMIQRVLEGLPDRSPPMRLVDLVLALDTLPVRAGLAPPTDDVGPADSLLPRWMSPLIVVERQDRDRASPSERAAARVRAFARSGVLGALEAAASGDVERYRRLVGAVQTSLGRDFASTPRTHSAQAALRWIEALPLESLSELARAARIDAAVSATERRP